MLKRKIDDDDEGLEMEKESERENKRCKYETLCLNYDVIGEICKYLKPKYLVVVGCVDRQCSMIVIKIIIKVPLHKAIEHDAILSKHTYLQRLDLDHNRFITDKSIMHLTNLTDLSLNYNHTITDQSLCLLTNLVNLSIGHNSIITDVSVSMLTQLTYINVSFNKGASLKKNDLSDIDARTVVESITSNSISCLTNLVILEMDCHVKTINNKILMQLTSLKSLHLHDCYRNRNRFINAASGCDSYWELDHLYINYY